MQRSHQKLHIVFWKPECWSFIFAHSQHMAVTIHWLFRNMHGHSFMLLYIHVSDATAYNTLNTLKIVASHGRWQKLVSADSPILSLYLYKRSGAKSHLAMGLDTLLWLTQLELGWDLMDLPTSAKLWFCDRLSPQTGGDYTTSLSVFDHPQWKEMCFLMFRYILFCARCLLSYQQTLLKSVLLPLLHFPPFQVFIHNEILLILILLFLHLNSPSSLTFSWNAPVSYQPIPARSSSIPYTSHVSCPCFHHTLTSELTLKVLHLFPPVTPPPPPPQQLSFTSGSSVSLQEFHFLINNPFSSSNMSSSNVSSSTTKLSLTMQLRFSPSPEQCPSPTWGYGCTSKWLSTAGPDLQWETRCSCYMLQWVSPWTKPGLRPVRGRNT